ncbi:amino acid adenylation domain-containing protein [Mariniflexile fucanivorans]|uniref:Amino acid adenylation domain-containing protein n=1 Tax=Mariniflexile fucanivorans TaxID=264023 RepID=A0A4R1RKG5_9FLAO|nr:non-ribosomal peptide synthetase [Mariniflexile fucanivorans]TCL66678.1 amino acid adenylation domain-containing protein [Mariniflexile fucanivorans]
MKIKSQHQNKTQLDPLTHEIESIIQTTNTQLEIWTDCLIGSSDANKAYNLSYSITFKGDLILETFQNAVDALVGRHESLRASFSSNGIYMNVFKNLKVEIRYDDISQFSVNEKEKTKETIIDEEVNSVFDLVKEPLFKVKIIKINDYENVVVLTHHHIIGDGLSINIIVEELSIIYSSLIENTIPKLKKPERFSDYAKTVNALLPTSEFKQIEDFWLDIYKESVPTVELPTDFVRPPLRTYDSQRLDFPIDTKLIDSLKQVATNAGCSLATAVLGAYEVFLYKITGQNDLIVGVPVSGNRQYDMKHLIGDCANLLPIRSKINPKISFLDYLKLRNPELLGAYKNHQLSFGHLLQKLSVARDPSRVPMVPVTLTVDLNRDLAESKFSFTGLSHEFMINPKKFTSFEMHLHVCMCEQHPTFQWAYNTSLFKEETINQMMLSFEDIINKLTADQNGPLADVINGDYLADYNKLNDTETPYPNVSLAELLNKQSEISPNNIAIEYKNTQITYQDLHIKVNQFAHYLEAQGVQSGDYIAVSYPRSPELVYAILAIIQCGAAYLPLDHEYPTKRVEYMMEDSEAKYLLTSKALSLSLPKCSNTILIDDAMQALHQYPTSKLERFVDPENVLYLLYTSGSTGRPKGAKITNRNVVNLFYSLQNEPGIKETDRVPFISTISFDIASFELFFPLFKGAVLVIPDHETPSDGRLFLEMLEKEKISLIVATPTTYQMLLDSGWNKKLPIKIWCCGEPLPAKLAKELIDKSDELWTLYGPTEVTIFSSCKHIKDEDTIISVGGPINNMQYYIVDEHLNLLPPNAIGEIAIGGDGVGKGYLGKPELTAAKYIPNKFSDKKDAIMYLSGDIGKLLPSNEVMCLGRIDHQVKVRGHRIEIGEIEHALTSIEGVKSAIVLAKKDILVAFIVVDYEYSSELDEIRSWRNELASQLPTFMVPHIFHILEKMPRTLNDKVDRTALLEYKSTSENEDNYTAPRTKEEQLVANIWQDILKKERIDIFSNFFEMGGHSIMAVNVMVAIEKKMGKRIPLSALFQHSTVEKFAKLLTVENEISSDYLVPLKPTGTKTPFFIVHGKGLNILNFAHIIKHFDEDQPIYGFQGVGPDGYDNWFESVEAMAARYVESVLEVNPKGPYAIAGFSFGGMVAFEMARQLKAQGKTVSIIAALDSYVDSSYYSPTLWQKKLVRYYDRTYRRLDYLIQMFTSWEALKLRARTKKVYLQKKYLGLKDEITEQEAVAHELYLEADRMVSTLVDKYQLKPDNFEVELFRAKDDDTYKLDPNHLGWKKAALNGVNIHNISGNHLSIVEPPNDKKLACMLQDLLDKKHLIK